MEEYKAILEEARKFQWKQGPAPEHTRDLYVMVLEAYRYLGAHASVLAEPNEWGFRLKKEEDGWWAYWNRPKTRHFMQMALPESLVTPLRDYLASGWDGNGKHYSRQQLWRIVRECGARAGVEGLSPLSLRHLRGVEVDTKFGSGTAQHALGVSERTLRYYTALRGKTLLRELRKEMG